MIVAPNEGLADLLDYVLRTSISGFVDWSLMLWINDLFPSQTTVYSSLVPATFGGYSPVTLTRSSWTPAVINANKAESTYTTTPITWTATTGPQTVYGYAIVTTTSPVIRFVERFMSPITVNVGGILALLPKITLTTGTSGP